MPERAQIAKEATSVRPRVELKGPTRAGLVASLGNMWTWLFLLLLIVFFSITAKGFFDLFNFQALLANMAIITVIATGQTYVIITGGIDLSTGYVMGFSSVLASLAIRSTTNLTVLEAVLIGFGVSLAVGLVIGFINGALVANLRVPPFIATLGTMGIAEGLAYVISGGPPVSIQLPGLGNLGNGYLIYYTRQTGLTWFSLPSGVPMSDASKFVPLMAIYLAVLIAVAAWVLSKTRFGVHVYAVGGNEKAAYRSGIPVVRRKIQVYMLSAAFAGIAGFLYMLRYSGGVASAGDPLLLQSIAGIVIGGCSLMGGRGTIIGTLAGALTVTVIQNGLAILGINPFWQYVAVGVVIIIAVLVDQARDGIIGGTK